jgi:hypothetical protein
MLGREIANRMPEAGCGVPVLFGTAVGLGYWMLGAGYW